MLRLTVRSAVLATLFVILATWSAAAQQARPIREPFVELSPSSGGPDTMVRVTGWANCPGDEVFIFFGGKLAARTALVWPAPDSEFVPHDEWDFYAGFAPSAVEDAPTAPGDHTVLTSCSADGSDVQASTSFRLEGEIPAEQRGGAAELNLFYQGFPAPAAVGSRVNAVGSFGPDTDCDRVYVSMEGERVAEGPAHLDGKGFSGLVFEVPSDMSPGDKRVDVSCDEDGEPVLVSSILRVGGSTTSGEGPGEGIGRPSFVSAVHSIDQLDWSPGHVGASMLVALLLLLLLFPAELFNSTLDANYEEIRGWFGFLPKREGSERKGLSRSWLGLIIFAFVAAIIYGFLDPSFGIDQTSLVLVIGLVVSMLFATLVFGVPIRMYRKKKGADTGTINVAFGALVVAVICVVISRIADFLPGYFYGVLAGFVFADELSEEEDGRVNALTVIWLLIASVAAWLSWIPVRGMVEDGGGFVLTLVETCLVTVFVGGLESAFIGLIPMRFLKGEKVFGWKRTLWALLFAVSGFLFVQAILRPGAGASESPLVTVVVLFLAFGLASVMFWGYFRFRRTGRA